VPPLALVAGSIAANYRNGGIAWERLSWALGLGRIGFEIFIVDQLDRGRCVYADASGSGYGNCLNRTYFEEVIETFELGGSAALVGDRGESLYGPSYAELLELAESAVMVVNVAGNLRLDEVKRRSRLNVFVDVDPGFTQLWLASGTPAPRIEGHDLYFTIGENVGTPACSLPTSGLSWRHTRQPVLLDEWPLAIDADEARRFTTVARWRGTGPHGRLDDHGLVFGQKADEFQKVIDLPQRVPATFEIALSIDPADVEGLALLKRHGWQLADPLEVASDPEVFRAYVRSSSAEFSVAKGVYAKTNTGWFGDRTTRYLASGKPAQVQDTGFGRSIPVGEGLLAFRTVEDAVTGARRIAAKYSHHAESARQLAEEHFAAEVVLDRFLDEALGPGP
jgi:hypothetical protein